ncbi:MAG: SDR family oxidoreductase [Wenzhouxiangellaceae bacterium]
MAQQPLAVITGASGGIGAALAAEFAADGCDLLLVARNHALLHQVAAELEQAHGVSVMTCAVDLATADAMDVVEQRLQQLARAPTYLVNNAGVGDYGRFWVGDELKQWRMIDLNVTALTRLTRRLLPQLISNRGGLLNVASDAAFRAGPGMAVYFATKAYVLSFSEALAEELAEQQVRVTCLCPGPTLSGFQQAAGLGEPDADARASQPDAATVAAAGYRAFRRGRRVYIHGWKNRWRVLMLRFTSRRRAARALWRNMRSGAAGSSSD